MPVPKTTTPPLISDSDISNAAATLEVEPAVIYAVSKVESGGRTGFDSKGRPKILFKPRWFHKFTGSQFDKSHPHLSQPTWEGAKKYYDRDQWQRLVEALALDAEAALKSASWGKFQVMGFNHSGFENVFSFCGAMCRSEAEHLKSFLAYCKNKGLVKYLKSKDWASFACGYNGKKYKENKYDQKLQDAYEKIQEQKEGQKMLSKCFENKVCLSVVTIAVNLVLSSLVVTCPAIAGQKGGGGHHSAWKTNKSFFLVK